MRHRKLDPTSSYVMRLRLSRAVSFPVATPARRVGSFRGYPFVMTFLAGVILPARKFRMLLHTNPTRERGECLGTRAGASEDL